ncbi:hypothetical protein U1Q18_004156 [Sarracenia purpurea var. burkii]
MSVTKSSASYKIQSLVKVLYRYRICTGGNPSHEPYRRGASLVSKFGYGFYGHSMHDGLRMIRPDAAGISTNATADKVPPSAPPPQKPNFPTWAKWLLGSVLSIVLPFWGPKWKNLLLFEGKVEEVVEEVEIVAEVVEKVANTAEKVAEEVVENLPDTGKLKEAALLVEHVSIVTAQDAELTKVFIHKVEELKDDLTDLGAMVEPVIDKIIAKEHGGK